MTSRKQPVYDDIAADIKKIDRDLEARRKARDRGDEGDESINALLDARHRLTELAAGLAVPTETEPTPEGSS